MSDDEKELKRQFGLALKLYGDSYQAAFSIFPEDAQRAVWVANYWINDPIVIESEPDEEEDEKVSCDEEWKQKYYADVPRLLKLAETDPKIATAKNAIWAKVLEVSGNVQPRTAPKQASSSIIRVMEVPVFQNDEKWEENAAKQQSELLNVSTTRH